MVYIVHYEQKNNGDYLYWKQVDGWAPRTDHILRGWRHWEVSVNELFETFPDLTRANLRAQWRRQESERQTGIGLQTAKNVHVPQPVSNLGWRSAQHMTSQAPAYKGRYIKARSGLRLIITRLTEHVRLPIRICGIFRFKINGRLVIGELERMHQFTEWAVQIVPLL